MQPIHRLIYVTSPKPSNPEYGSVDGAYATCWVREPVLGAADAIAREYLDREGWEVEESDEFLLVTETSCPPGTPGREFFEQAQTDDLVLVLHTWPVGAPDDR